MTKISVSTGPLASSASRLQAQGRGAGERAHGVEAVLRSLDLEIKAREHIDARLRALSSQLSGHARQLSAQGRFLSYAVGRYEGAEEQVIASQARGEAHIGVGPAGGGGGGGWGDDGRAGATSVNLTELLRLLGYDASGGDEDLALALAFLVGGPPLLQAYAAWRGITLLNQAGELTGFPISGGIGTGLELAERIWKNPALKAVGKGLTVLDIAYNLKEDDRPAVIWDLLTFTPAVGKYVAALQFGWQTGEWIARDLGVSDRFVGHPEGMDGWSPNYDRPFFDKVRDAGDAMHEGLTTAVSSAADDWTARAKGVWNWLTP